MAKKKTKKKKHTQTNKQVKKKSLKESFENHPLIVSITAIGMILGVISTIILVIQGVREFSTPKPSIKINELDFLSAQNVNTDQPILVEQIDTIIPVEDKEYVIDHFSSENNKYNVQYILVTNMDDNNAITLTNFKLNVENIKVDFTPVISTEISYNNADNSFLLQISNKGWSDISNVKIRMMDKENKLDFSKYSTIINTIKYGTTCNKEININLNDFDFLKKEEGDYPICFEISYNEAQENNIIETNYSLCIENSKVSINLNGLTLPHTGGYLAYGILIDTAKSDFTFNQSIQEVIDSGQVLELPFFFFPNRSCEFDYYFEFDVLNGNKKQTVCTDFKHVKYRVSSVVNLEQYDASHYDTSYFEMMNNCIISFPYTLVEMNKTTDSTR